MPWMVLAAIFLLSLCFRVAEPGFAPKEMAENLWTGLRLQWARVFKLPLFLDRWDIIGSRPYYYEAFLRLKNSLVTCFSGMALCMAGAAYQTVFQNPLASPNTLGITAGVKLGNVVFVLVFAWDAIANLHTRYLYCYGFSAVILLLILLAGKLAGYKSRSFSVLDMVLVGVMMTQLCDAVAGFLEYRLESQSFVLLMVYQQLSLGALTRFDDLSMLLFVVMIVLSLIPILLVRYRFNATAFTDDEALMMGVHPQRLRFVGMACGSILALTALIHCGDIGLLAMAVPHICRYWVGSDFRKLCAVSMAAGGVLLLIGRIVSSLVIVAGVEPPVNFFVSLAIVPLFILALLSRRNSFA